MKAEKSILCAIARGDKKAPLVLKNAFVANVFTGEVETADVALYNGVIAGVGQYSGEREEELTGCTICPGFIDAHMHLESLMVLPEEAARAITPWGTTTAIADPHEIVNVCGSAGLRFLLERTQGLPLDFYFMLPSSVPSTRFETNGATFAVQDMLLFLKEERVLGLGEIMCFDDVIAGDRGILEKIEAAAEGVCDGHAPCLTGHKLQAYAAAGIDTEHECTTWEEAKEKLSAGLRILIREGSAAKNVEAIVRGILEEKMPSDRFAFCTDDKHVDDVMREGHIRWNVKKAISLGMDPVEAVRMATLNAAQCYGLKRLGAVAPGYRADLVVLDNLQELNVLRVYKNGIRVTEDSFAGKNRPVAKELLDTVHLPELCENSISLRAGEENPVIELIPGQIMTKKIFAKLPQKDGFFAPDGVFNKLCVVERHKASGNLAVAPLKGYGIENGAVATTVAHDSHNLTAAGDNDRDILLAAKRAAEIGGGYVLVKNGTVLGELPLPVAGLISLKPGDEVVCTAQKMIAAAHAMGVSSGIDPFTTLSFLALPVIPELRLTDKGLFDVKDFQFIQ